MLKITAISISLALSMVAPNLYAGTSTTHQGCSELNTKFITDSEGNKRSVARLCHACIRDASDIVSPRFDERDELGSSASCYDANGNAEPPTPSFQKACETGPGNFSFNENDGSTSCRGL